jgi:hypothetical protein
MGAGDRAARKSRETLRENIARTDAIKLPELEKLFSLLGNEKIRERILHAKNL